MPLLVLWSFWACAPAAIKPAPPIQTPPQQSGSPSREGGLFDFSSADTINFTKGLAFLENQQNDPDYAKARAALAELLEKYPRSKWRDPAVSLIRLLDERTKLQGENFSDQAALNKAKGENDQLKRDLRAVNDRLQAETARLTQESEQLKKDLQLLKDLELQLDKRDRKLR